MADVFKRVAGQSEAKPETWCKTPEGRVLVFCKHMNAGMIQRGEPADWDISAEGVVTPSVYWRDTCGCHLIGLRLEGWSC